MAHHFTALVTVLSLVVYFVMAGKVGQARGKFGIQAPATTGNPEFERIFRVHQNTMESMVMFLPALWLFSAYVSDAYAALLGLVWIVGRIAYARAYYREAGARGPGTLISLGAVVVLVLGALVKIAMVLLKS